MLRDFSLALRSLWRAPLHTAVSVSTLAVGLAGCGAVFALADAVLFKPLPFPASHQLVRIHEVRFETGVEEDLSPDSFEDWRNHSGSFQSMALLAVGDFTLSGDDSVPRQVPGMRVSAEFFETLGFNAAFGRVLTPPDFESGGRVVLSRSLCRDRYGGPAQAVGRTVTIDGRSFTVVGVLEEDLRLPGLQGTSQAAQIWLPLDLPRLQRTYRRSARLFPGLARLRDGVSPAKAEAELQSVATRLAKERGDGNPQYRIALKPLQESLVAGSRKTMLVFLCGVILVWLICTANVANLTLARSLAREGQVALRLALGGSRAQLARYTFMESLAVALLAGLLGGLTAPWVLWLLETAAPPFPQVNMVSLDARSFLFLLSLTAASAFASGGLAAARGWRTKASMALQQSRYPTTPRTGRLTAALVASQFSLATALSVGAGLMAITFVELNRVDLGFEPQGVLSFRIALRPELLRDLMRSRDLIGRFVASLERLPEVSSAAVGSIPFTGSPSDLARAETGHGLRTHVNAVSPDYFRVLGVSLLRGRPFSGADREDALPVAVVSESLSRRLWPGEEEALGKRILLEGLEPDLWREVVGVAADLRRGGPQAEPALDLYLPQPQSERLLQAGILVKTSLTAPEKLLPTVQSSLAALDPEAPVTRPASLGRLLKESSRDKRFMTFLMLCLSSLALALAGLGLYGVIAAEVTSQTREIGVRMALGASRNQILKLFLLRGCRTVLIGLPAGLGAAWALSKVLASFLFRVKSTDPAIFLAVSALITAVALLACLIPGRRAALLSPLDALRER